MNCTKLNVLKTPYYLVIHNFHVRIICFTWIDGWMDAYIRQKLKLGHALSVCCI